MKIGIITITEGENYGNRLQNYAVQEYLKNYKNTTIETIHNYKNQSIKEYKKNEIKNKIKTYIKIIIGYKRKNNYNLLKREKNFKKFNKQYINYSKFKISNKDINKNINLYYDYFICGSDQIWNSNFEENDFVNFLQFADSEKRIAFAPSFGTDQISERKVKKYSKWLKEIPYLSIREERGKEIINELTGRNDVKVLVDPTMLISEKEWLKIAKKPKKLRNNKYILTYFLGRLSEKRKSEINRVAIENNCEVINILDKNNSFYQCGPSEFLYLLKNAFLICTDSFHSCVFAIIFNRPFIIFDREDKNIKMNSRIETLLKKFELEDRWYKDSISKKMLQSNYNNAYKILEKERKKAKEYLDYSIEKKEET